MSIVKVAGIGNFFKKLTSNGAAMAENSALKKELSESAIALKKAEELAAKKHGVMLPLAGGVVVGAGGAYGANQIGQKQQGYY